MRKDTCTPVFTATLFTTAKTWGQPKHPPTGGWVKRMCEYTHMYICNIAHIKKSKIMPFVATWITLEMIKLREVREKKKNSIDIYMWNLKYDMKVKVTRLCLTL